MNGAGSAPRFLDVELPARFVLQVERQRGGWVEHGIYDASGFARNDDGSYVCAGHGLSPTFLRCVKREGDVITVPDGAGQPFRYRIVAADQPPV